MISTNPTHIINARTDQSCTNPVCFFCIMKELDDSKRAQKMANFFKDMPSFDNDDNILVVSSLWNIAMSQPNDPELPSLGIFQCMAKLIEKGVNNKEWLFKGQNIYIPYYAAHIIGSYTMNKAHFAQKAVESGIIPPLMELLRGKMSWVEQRVAVRALGHLASYEKTFAAIAAYEEEVVKLAMHISPTCIDVVYNSFVAIKDPEKRPKYHRDLLTRGMGGMEIENRKAEEWASQLQCWSLHLLNCFAYKKRSLDLICKPDFLRNLCSMWGGLVNDASPAGYGLIRVLCYSRYSRKFIAEFEYIIVSLGDLSRSSDDWQYVGIDCLLLLLKDRETRYKVINTAIDFLADLVELKTLGGRSNVGQKIINILLLDRNSLGAKSKMTNEKTQQSLDEIKGLMERQKIEKMMSDEKMEERKVLVNLTKEQGNRYFRSGNIEEAISKYSEGLEFCPLKLRRQRIVLLSNRAQCYLLSKDPNATIRDTTRALCLTTPPNFHSKSLWRRSQAYDMKGLAKESLMDCLMFLNCCVKENSNYVKIPYHAALMISKHMKDTWLFNASRLKSSVNISLHEVHESNGENYCRNYKTQQNERIGMGKEGKDFASGRGTFSHGGGSEGRKERNKTRNKAAISLTM